MENLTEFWWKSKTKDITKDWFNNASEDEIKRFIIGYNDGGGDHGFYTYSKIVNLLKNSDRSSSNELEDMTRMNYLK